VTGYVLGPAVQLDLIRLIGRTNYPLARILFFAGNCNGGKPFKSKSVLQDSCSDRDGTDNGKAWLHDHLNPS